MLGENGNIYVSEFENPNTISQDIKDDLMQDFKRQVAKLMINLELYNSSNPNIIEINNT